MVSNSFLNGRFRRKYVEHTVSLLDRGFDFQSYIELDLITTIPSGDGSYRGH